MDTGIKIAVIVFQVILLIILLYSIYTVSVTGKMTTFMKWLIVGSSAGILMFADKVRCAIGIGALIVALIAKYITDKKMENETT